MMFLIHCIQLMNTVTPPVLVVRYSCIIDTEKMCQPYTKPMVVKRLSLATYWIALIWSQKSAIITN